jgi:HEAT repeats
VPRLLTIARVFGIAWGALLAGMYPGSLFAQTASGLIKQLENTTVFWKQFEVGKKIVALHDNSVLPRLEPWLQSEDMHLRGNAAFVFARLGDDRGFEVIKSILGNRSPKRALFERDSTGQLSPRLQIRADRYYAAHLLGDLRDPRAVPILISLLEDDEVKEVVPWSLAEIGDKSAIPALRERLHGGSLSMRASVVQALEKIQGKGASQEGSLSANASCYEKATGKLVGSSKSVTSVLVSPDGLYRAYAESEAVASPPSGNNAECQNTSKLFVAGPTDGQFRAVLTVKPSPEELGNNIDLIDWSPNGHRLLLAEGVWQWGSDAGEIMARVYDADAETLSREALVREAFSKSVGKNCAGVFYPQGFSSSGEIVVRGEPYIEVAEDKPDEDSCVRKSGVWLLDTLTLAISRAPDHYGVKRYAKVAQ